MNAVQPRFAERHPIAYFLLLFVGMMFVYILGGAIATIGKLDMTAQILISDGLLTALALIIIARLGWWEEAGLAPVHGARPWLLTVVPFLGGLYHLMDGIQVTAFSQIATYVVCAVLVGFAEEIYFRGLFMRILKPYGQGAVLFWSTLLFGVTHALNVLNGQSAIVTVVQIANAAAIGFLFAVLRQKIGSIWTLVVAHALTDFLCWMTQGAVNADPEQVTLSMLILPAAFAVAFVVNAIWLLRSPKQA